MANRERQRLSRLQKKEIGLATMLLCVVVVFLLCNVWALISNVAEAFYGITVDQLVKVSNLLVTINSSVNFVIYVIFGEKFKRLFFKLFFPRGVWMCGLRAADGRPGGHAAMDESEATCNGAAAIECRHMSGLSDRLRRSHRSRHYHHHRHGGGGGGGGGSGIGGGGRNRTTSRNDRGGNDGGGGIDGSGIAGDQRDFLSKATTNSGIVWEHSMTTTTTNVNQI
jgi:hypothetical protein